MNIVVIDGQSGRMGQLFIEKARASGIDWPLTAVGTNALATAAMLKARSWAFPLPTPACACPAVQPAAGKDRLLKGNQLER